MRMPTHGDFPWERDERRRYSERRFRLPARIVRLRTVVVGFALIAAVAGVIQFGGHGSAGIGGEQVSLPGAYVAVPGPWHWRWVRVENPPPGTPHYVRQRYRMVKYVSATPLP